VTARELLLRVRLRLRPQATLARYLAEVENKRGLKAGERSPKTVEIRQLLPRTAQDSAAARRCFELLKNV
jgi:hypothetical protein